MKKECINCKNCIIFPQLVLCLHWKVQIRPVPTLKCKKWEAQNDDLHDDDAMERSIKKDA